MCLAYRIYSKIQQKYCILSTFFLFFSTYFLQLRLSQVLVDFLLSNMQKVFYFQIFFSIFYCPGHQQNRQIETFLIIVIITVIILFKSHIIKRAGLIQERFLHNLGNKIDLFLKKHYTMILNDLLQRYLLPILDPYLNLLKYSLRIVLA